MILQSKPLLEGTVESFKGYKTLSNVLLVYLEVKLQQASYEQCI